MWYALPVIGVLAAGAWFLDQGGEAAEQTGNAGLKLAGAALVVGGAYYLYRRA